jgi:hypothetical protein
MPVAASGHSATLLPNGKVLVAGGQGPGVLANAQVFDPASPPNGTWIAVSPLNRARRFHSAILLPNGKVLVMGGIDPNQVILSSAEIFDPATGKWTLTAPLATARVSFITALLPNAKVLVAGGQDTNFLVTATSELYEVGLGFADTSRPQITTVPSALILGNSLSLTGSKFRGLSEASGGNGTQNSSSDCPIVQLRSIETGRLLSLSSTNWQTNSYLSLPIANFPLGHALATMFVNGIPSESRDILVFTPLATPIVLRNPTKLPNGSFRFDFTNTPGDIFTALASTALSPDTQTVLGDVKEISPGQFQFTDLQTTNNPRRFYRVHSP